MKPEVMWSFVADQFIVDQTGKFRILGAWEAIGAVRAVHPQLFVAIGGAIRWRT